MTSESNRMAAIISEMYRALDQLQDNRPVWAAEYLRSAIDAAKLLYAELEKK
jgi:hypothetical protein